MASKLLVARAAVTLAGTALLLYVAYAQGQRPEDPVRILYPANRTLHSGPVRFVAATPKATARLAATLDGKPLALRRLSFAESWVIGGKLKASDELVGDKQSAAVWAAEVTLTPGPHVAVIGGKRLELRGAKDARAAAPAGFTRAYAHGALTMGEGKLDCGGCHERAGDTLGAVSTPRACASCHDETSVQLVHSHVPEPLNRCAMCHDPHGALRPKLALDEKKRLCAKCHEAGHIK